MRTATLVLVAYLICVVVGAFWRLLPWFADAIPDIGALTAAYLGLTARRQVSPGAWPVMVMKPKLRIDAPMAAASRSTTQTLRPRCAAV